MRASKGDNTVSSMEIIDSCNDYTPLTEDRRYSVATVLSGVRQRPVKVAAACLAVLCFLLLFVVIGQAVHNRNAEKDNEQNLKALSTVQEKLQQSVSDAALKKKQITGAQTRLQEEYDYVVSQRNQLQTNNNILSKERDTLKASQSQQQAQTAALTKERDQLRASQSKLQSSNAESAKARDFLQKSYDALSLKMTGIQKTNAALERQRDELQDQNAQLRHASEQLTLNFTTLLSMITHLEFSKDISSQEKEKLRSSHDIVLEQRDQLNTSLLVLEATSKQLQEGYTAVVKERDELQAAKADLSASRDLLLVQNQNLTTERDLLLAQVKNTTHETGCPSGWLTYQQSCYFSSTTEKSWRDSRAQCVQQGADLVMVRNSDEMRFLNSILESGAEVWIGLTDDGTEGEWMWVDGTRMTTSFWAKGQPNNHLAVDQDCVEFWSSSSTYGSWNDETCSVQAKWVCKK